MVEIAQQAHPPPSLVVSSWFNQQGTPLVRQSNLSQETSFAFNLITLPSGLWRPWKIFIDITRQRSKPNYTATYWTRRVSVASERCYTWWRWGKRLEIRSDMTFGEVNVLTISSKLNWKDRSKLSHMASAPWRALLLRSIIVHSREMDWERAWGIEMRNKEACIPFQRGKRACIGRRFSPYFKTNNE